MTASYYIRNITPDLSKRNSWAILILLDHDNWPERNRATRGATIDRYLCRRPMTPREMEEVTVSFRLMFYRYTNWQDLLEDEVALLGEDHEFIRYLESQVHNFSNIPRHKVGKQKELF